MPSLGCIFGPIFKKLFIKDYSSMNCILLYTHVYWALSNSICYNFPQLFIKDKYIFGMNLLWSMWVYIWTQIFFIGVCKSGTWHALN